MTPECLLTLPCIRLQKKDFKWNHSSFSYSWHSSLSSWWLSVPSLTDAQKKLNYRISRAHIVVKNAFGRLKARWHRLLKQNEMDVCNVPAIIHAWCVLHYVRSMKRNVYGIMAGSIHITLNLRVEELYLLQTVELNKSKCSCALLDWTDWTHAHCIMQHSAPFIRYHCVCTCIGMTAVISNMSLIIRIMTKHVKLTTTCLALLFIFKLSNERPRMAAT